MMRVGRNSRGGGGGGGGLGGARGGGRGYYPVTTFGNPRGFIYPTSPVRPPFFPSQSFYDASKRPSLSEVSVSTLCLKPAHKIGSVFPPPSLSLSLPFSPPPSPQEPVPPTLLEVASPPTALAMKPAKNPLQVLEEVCLKNGWGQALFTLHVAQDTSEEQVFFYKVTIASLGVTFVPNKACYTVEEAKAKAAEVALINLGLPMEGAPVCVCSVLSSLPASSI